MNKLMKDGLVVEVKLFRTKDVYIIIHVLYLIANNCIRSGMKVC